MSRAGRDPEPEPEEPAESPEESDHPAPILAPPTANPARVRVPPEGLHPKTDQEDPERSGSPPGEET
ncbi:hypothetical protein ACFOW4_12120 [Micromonospora sp. GCM10011542]|uniref:hypothetical protein n=1 Tax=Micromonospora sp. GCM10011542 TaxID=3317337 RepID=UPI0036108139